jgi:Novel STAND NTPase 1/TIR domain
VEEAAVANVFISHASKDREAADRVRQWLRADGHEVFLARAPGDGVALGEEWQPRLYERLRWADAVVCLVSRAYRNSVWCTAELAIAHERGSRVLPFLVEPGPPHPLVPTLQHVEYGSEPDAARAALREALSRLDGSGGRGWSDDRSPFPGLLAFDVDMHRAFFGRRAEVEQLAALLRSPAGRAEPAVQVVVGPSGCGKSSLVRAGLLAVMAEEPGWLTLPPVVPGMDPVAALARELAAASHRAGLGWTMESVLGRLDADPSGLSGLADELLVAASRGKARRLLVVMDQMEELCATRRLVVFPAQLGGIRRKYSWI